MLSMRIFVALAALMVIQAHAIAAASNPRNKGHADPPSTKTSGSSVHSNTHGMANSQQHRSGQPSREHVKQGEEELESILQGLRKGESRSSYAGMRYKEDPADAHMVPQSPQ